MRTLYERNTMFNNDLNDLRKQYAWELAQPAGFQNLYRMWKLENKIARMSK